MTPPSLPQKTTWPRLKTGEHLASYNLLADTCISPKVLKEIQSKKEAEMVQKIIAQVKAECEAKGGDLERRGYTKHY